MSTQSFKSSAVYQNATGKIQDCVKHKAELGNNLSDYEIMECAYDAYHLYETAHHN